MVRADLLLIPKIVMGIIGRAFRSTARSPWLTTRLGLWLGVCFGICFITGLISHQVQHPASWWLWPSRPVNLYRVTQGLHVATGLASIPLLSAKLWSVYPKLFQWPPLRSVVHAADRLSAMLLIGAALFEVVTGILNIAHWYEAMPFGFIAAHYWTAWLLVGSVLLHVAVRLPVIREALVRTTDEFRPLVGPTRRGVLVIVGSAMAAVTLATVGQTLRPLSRVSVLAPRRPDAGPQGLPVNTSAVSAGVIDAARDPDYRLVLRGPTGQRSLTLAELAAMPQHDAHLPIACVEGWSADGAWSGVRLSELVALVGGTTRDSVEVRSLQQGGYNASVVAPQLLADPSTLIALRLNGAPLHIDHGSPCRLIAPNRPGALQTKWLGQVTVLPS